MSSSNSNPSWFASKRYKKNIKKPVESERLPELGDDIATDDELNSYRPGLNVDHMATAPVKTSSSTKTSTITKEPSTATATLTKDKCICCQRPLVRKDKEGIITFSFPKCKDCEGKVCRKCLIKNRCHECSLKRELKDQLIPDVMLRKDRAELMEYIKLLHYPADAFEDMEKKYLVKQIFVRYNVQPNWDPKIHDVVNTSFENQTKINDRKDSVSTVNENDRTPNKYVGSKQRPDIDSGESSTNTSIINEKDYRNKNQKGDISLPESQYSEMHMQGLHGRPGFNKKIPGQMQVDITKGLQESVKDKNLHRESWPTGPNTINLLEVKTPAYFDSLTMTELRAILKQHSLPSDDYNEKHELKFAVLRLWNSLRDQAPRPPPSPALVAMSPPIQTFATEVKFVHEISSVDVIDDLSTNHMIQLMRNHGQNVPPDMKRHEISYELKNMWYQYEAQEKQKKLDEQMKLKKREQQQKQLEQQQKQFEQQQRLFEQQKLLEQQQKLLEQQRRPIEPQRHQGITRIQNEDLFIERAPSLSDIQSAKEIENLSPNQLREVLANNEIDPRQYPEVHHMRYLVRQLWYRTKPKETSQYRPNNVHNRSMEVPHNFDDRYRSSTRRPNLQKGKSMSELTNLESEKSIPLLNSYAKSGLPTSAKSSARYREREESFDTSTTDSAYQQLAPSYTRQMSVPVLALSLGDLRTLEDIQDLSTQQLRAILTEKRVAFPRNADRSDLAWQVKELWLGMKAAESEQQRMQDNYNDTYNHFNYNRPVFTPVNIMTQPPPPPPPPLSPLQYKSNTVQRTISLDDIKRLEEIVTLSKPQMRNLLVKYNVRVVDPDDKAGLMELTRQLWIKRMNAY
ncbi:hypothetical protein CHUAL_005665 [Chamberlinius hualienensis]